MSRSHALVTILVAGVLMAGNSDWHNRFGSVRVAALAAVLLVAAMIWAYAKLGR
jgi:hypothetical protein